MDFHGTKTNDILYKYLYNNFFTISLTETLSWENKLCFESKVEAKVIKYRNYKKICTSNHAIDFIRHSTVNDVIL